MNLNTESRTSITATAMAAIGGLVPADNQLRSSISYVWLSLMVNNENFARRSISNTILRAHTPILFFPENRFQGMNLLELLYYEKNHQYIPTQDLTEEDQTFIKTYICYPRIPDQSLIRFSRILESDFGGIIFPEDKIYVEAILLCESFWFDHFRRNFKPEAEFDKIPARIELFREKYSDNNKAKRINRWKDFCKFYFHLLGEDYKIYRKLSSRLKSYGMALAGRLDFPIFFHLEKKKEALCEKKHCRRSEIILWDWVRNHWVGTWSRPTT